MQTANGCCWRRHPDQGKLRNLQLNVAMQTYHCDRAMTYGLGEFLGSVAPLFSIEICRALVLKYNIPGSSAALLHPASRVASRFFQKTRIFLAGVYCPRLAVVVEALGVFPVEMCRH